MEKDAPGRVRPRRPPFHHAWRCDTYLVAGAHARQAEPTLLGHHAAGAHGKKHAEDHEDGSKAAHAATAAAGATPAPATAPATPPTAGSAPAPGATRRTRLGTTRAGGTGTATRATGTPEAAIGATSAPTSPAGAALTTARPTRTAARTTKVAHVRRHHEPPSLVEGLIPTGRRCLRDCRAAPQCPRKV